MDNLHLNGDYMCNACPNCGVEMEIVRDELICVKCGARYRDDRLNRVMVSSNNNVVDKCFNCGYRGLCELDGDGMFCPEIRIDMV